MKTSSRLQICWVLCSILLISPGIRCLSIHILGKRDIPAPGELGETESTSSLNLYPETSLLTTPSFVAKTSQDSITQPHGTSSKNIFTSEEEAPRSYSLLSNSTVSSEINSPSLVFREIPKGQTKTSNENGILTPAVSTVDYMARVTSPSKTTALNSDRYQTAHEDNATSLEQMSQADTIEMLTINPRTGNGKAGEDQSTSDSLVTDVTSLDTVTVTSVNLQSSLVLNPQSDLKSTTQVNKNNGSTTSTISQISQEWDDTKIKPTYFDKRTELDNITLNPDETTSAYMNKVIGDEGDTTFLTTFQGLTVQSGDNTTIDITKNIYVIDEEEIPTISSEQSKIYSVSTVPEVDTATRQDENNSPSTLDATTASMSLNQQFPVSFGGNESSIITPGSTPQSLEDPNMTSMSTVLMNLVTNDSASESAATEPDVKRVSEEAMVDNITEQWSSLGSTTNTGLSGTDPFDSTPTTEGVSPQPQEELVTAISQPITVFTVAATVEEKATTATTVTSSSVSSQINVMEPSVQRISSTAAYGEDRLESEAPFHSLPCMLHLPSSHAELPECFLCGALSKGCIPPKLKPSSRLAFTEENDKDSLSLLQEVTFPFMKPVHMRVILEPTTSFT
ncbi:armadillo-like helical domain-containing protein 4 [Discoglossus pictus]